MKRINHIVNPQGVRSEALTRKEERIKRQVDQAIAAAEDTAAEFEEAAENIIDTLGTASGKEDTGKLQNAFQKYMEAKENAWAWMRQVVYLNELKAALDKEVEVTVNPTHVVVDK